MKNLHRFLESTVLPLLIIVLVPIAVILYLVFGTGASSPAPVAPAQQSSATTTTTNVPQPTATIFLNDASELPQTVPTTQFIPFSFTIQNTGTTDGTVPYRVSVKWSTGEQDVIDENVVSLAAGASTVVQEQLKFEIATETAEVSLQLPETGQSVQFALPATN